MTSSDRHEVICAIAADLYNENGSMEDAKLTPEDVREIVDRYQGTATYAGIKVHVYKLMDIRMPTEEEIRIALFQVMGAQMASPEDGSCKPPLQPGSQDNTNNGHQPAEQRDDFLDYDWQCHHDSAEIDHDDPINQG